MYMARLSHCENNLETIGTLSVAQCFRTQARMLSGPVAGAFLVSTSFEYSSWMPTGEIGGTVR